MGKNLCDCLQTTAHQHKRIMNNMLEPFGLTYAQYLVLKKLQAEEGLSAKALLSELDTDKATLSGIISRLEKADWLRREKDAEDRRLMHIFLTENARVKLPEIVTMEGNCEDVLLVNFKNREIKNFKELFKKLIEAQEEALKTNNRFERKI